MTESGVQDHQTSGDLAEWNDAQQAEDIAALRSMEGNAIAVKLAQADIIARIVPMGVQGHNGEITKRVATLAHETAWPVSRVETFRRVGCRWLPEHRAAAQGTILAWETIVVAATYAPGTGNDLNPCAVLARLCTERDRVTTQAYQDEFAQAVADSVPKPDVPAEPVVTFADILGDLEPDPPTPVVPTVFEQLTTDIKGAGGKAADRDAATLAAGDLAGLLLSAEIPLAAFLSRYALVKDTPAGRPLRLALIKFLRRIVTEGGIDPQQLHPTEADHG